MWTESEQSNDDIVTGLLAVALARYSIGSEADKQNSNAHVTRSSQMKYVAEWESTETRFSSNTTNSKSITIGP